MAFAFKIKTTDEILEKFGMQPYGKMQKAIDSEVLRQCDPYVPKDTGTLINSGITATQIGSGEVRYNTPYARRHYYIPMNHTEKRTHMWFEVMKKSGGRDKILEAARRALGQ